MVQKKCQNQGMSKKSRIVHYLRYCIEEKSQQVEGEYYRGKTFEEYMDEAIAKLEPGQEVKQRTTGKNIVLSLHNNDVIRCAGCKTSALYQREEGKGVAAEAKDEMGNHIVAGKPVIRQKETDINVSSEKVQYRMANLAEGATYFAYKGNHIAYFSSSCAASNILLSFFNYFLKTCTGVLADSSVIHEEKIFMVDPRTLLKHKGISKVAYKLAEMRDQGTLGQEVQEVMSRRINADPILRCKHEAIIQECNLDLILAPGRRDKGIKGETIKALLSSMTDYELDHTIVYFNDNETMKGKELFSKSKIFVEFEDGVPRQGDAQRAVSQWLARNINSDFGNSV